MCSQSKPPLLQLRLPQHRVGDAAEPADRAGADVARFQPEGRFPEAPHARGRARENQVPGLLKKERRKAEDGKKEAKSGQKKGREKFLPHMNGVLTKKGGGGKLLLLGGAGVLQKKKNRAAAA